MQTQLSSTEKNTNLISKKKIFRGMYTFILFVLALPLASHLWGGSDLMSYAMNNSYFQSFLTLLKTYSSQIMIAINITSAVSFVALVKQKKVFWSGAGLVLPVFVAQFLFFLHVVKLSVIAFPCALLIIGVFLVRKYKTNLKK